MNDRTYWVYIMTNRSGTLYVGMTNNLLRRVGEHRRGQVLGFTSRYKITRLVHAESCSDARAAITREKEIKGWRREKNIALIEATNPEWNDLGESWLGHLTDRTVGRENAEILRQAQDDTFESRLN